MEHRISGLRIEFSDAGKISSQFLSARMTTGTDIMILFGQNTHAESQRTLREMEWNSMLSESS